MKWAVIVETKEGAKLKGEYEDKRRIRRFWKDIGSSRRNGRFVRCF